jgi:2-hydroxymuconate-semialdehyde hydrolase
MRLTLLNTNSAEVGHRIDAGGILTNYHDTGTGKPVLLLHGSGPGVSAWANWRLNIPFLSQQFRVLAPDMAGFGFTLIPDGFQYSMDAWIKHAIDFLDALDVETCAVVGNSFGGALALALAIRFPERCSRLVLMGSVGVPFELTPGLDKVWGYEPSRKNMRELMNIFAYDKSLITDELVEMRYRASMREGIQEQYSAMFPAPRQRWADSMACSEEDIRGIRQATLIVHGREDMVIPLANAHTLLEWIEFSELHVFGRCGHWTQVEHAASFNQLIAAFLARGTEQYR